MQALSYPQGTIASAELIGAQETNWFWIVSESMDATAVGNILANAEYEPEWSDASTLFLAGFTDDLNAGNLNTTGYALYRRNLTTGDYRLIGEFGINELSVIDYSACNNHVYVYQLWYTDAATFTTTPIESNQIVPCSWSYTILGCTMDDDGIYHVQKIYPFTANISTATVSNNNEPKTQKNFTRYPSWQPDSAMYQSGKLKAFIGTVNNLSQYVGDTVEYANELRSLSITNMMLFLKDRRGEMLMIRPNGPVTMETKDEWYTQSAAIEFPWVEVGGTDGLSVIVSTTDSLWPGDSVSETTITIDPNTGKLIWTTPDGYTGSELALTGTGYLTQQSGAWVTPAQLSINPSTQMLTSTTA